MRLLTVRSEQSEAAFSTLFRPQHFPAAHCFSPEPQQALSGSLLSQSDEHLSLPAFVEDFASWPAQREAPCLLVEHAAISLAPVLWAPFRAQHACASAEAMFSQQAQLPEEFRSAGLKAWLGLQFAPRKSQPGRGSATASCIS